MSTKGFTMAQAQSAPDSAAEATPAAEEELVERPNMSDLAGVMYVGTADVKIMTPQHMKSIGAELKDNKKDPLVWSEDNDWTVDLSRLSAAGVDKLISLREWEAVER